MKRFFAAVLSIMLCMLVLSGCNLSVNTGFGATYQYENASSYTMGGAELTDTIDELEISWVNGKVTVQYHDGDTVLISEASAGELTEKTSLYYLVEGKTLKIQYAKSGVWSNFDFAKELTVMLPRTPGVLTVMHEYDLSFETVSADVEIVDIYASECEFENVSGGIHATLGGTVSSLQVQTVLGNVDVTALRIKSFDVESVSGTVTLRGDHIESGDAEMVSGDLNICLPEDTAGYTVDFESVSGDLHLSGEDYEKKNGLSVIGDGSFRYDVESVSGDCNIYYAQKADV